jgi:spectinomycin phosphotransferase
VRSRPNSVTDESIAHAVAAHWLTEAAEASYLPWGFGAHHWRVTGGGRTLFVTLDQLEPRHTAASLEAAYAGAAALADGGLDVVCAPLASRSGRFTIEAGAGALSVTPWLAGRTPAEAEALEPHHIRAVTAVLTALHRAVPPDGLPGWTPSVGLGFAAELRARTSRPWVSGPMAEEARSALAARHGSIERWTGRYLELAALARDHRREWAPTHGEPHYANQVITADGLKLVDWESLAYAPRERDHAAVLETGAGDGSVPDPAMLELFALDWRLSEIDEYARWFAAPHTGTEDDRIALDGLHEELSDATG